jgi:hypothetical protein
MPVVHAEPPHPLANEQPASDRLARALGLLAVGVLAAMALWLASIANSYWFGDADWYAAALPAVHGNVPLYDPVMLAPHVAARPVHFNLPPAMALLAPVAGLGRLPWGLLMLACLLAGLILVWPRLRRPWDLVMAGAVSSSIPFITAVMFANVNSLIFLLFAVALRWPRAAGAAIGVAAALKVAPIFALAWLVGRRDWSGLAIGLMVGIGLTLLAALLVDPNAIVDFVVVRLNELPRPGPMAISLTSFGTPPVLAYVLALAVAVAAAARRSMLLAVLACLVAVPVLHAHYWTWLLVPILGRGSPLLQEAVERMRGAAWQRGGSLAEPGA